jgi:UDP-GlcNAc:undecaprenyl-phosphate/decaprenyl-phosphate GlcNAc-1-phosphate transferase
MKTYLISFLISFFFVATITPVLIKTGIKYGFVDKVNRRKIHRGVIPRIGGIGIATGTLLPILLLFFYDNDVSQLLYSPPTNAYVIVFGGLMISLLGFIDDTKGVSAKHKLFFQIVLSVFVWYNGFDISAVSTPFGVIQLGIFGLPITVLWIVGIINAFNLIDGMDGLSSGVSFFACITIMTLSIFNGYIFVAAVSASLAGAVVGFLIYNFNPAKIFMGDTGSMFIGYILAVISLKNQSKGHTVVSLLVPVIAMGLPILDTTLAFLRRYLRKQSVFAADSQHIHHMLLSKGWNQRKVVLVLYSISILFTALAMLLIFQKDAQAFLIIAVFSIIVFVIMSKLGYADIFYSRFKTRKENRLENQIETFILSNMSRAPFDFENYLFSSLPIIGYDIFEPDGNILYSKGEKDNINYMDIDVENDVFVRLFWSESLPVINTKEVALLTLLAKSLANYLKFTQKN